MQTLDELTEAARKLPPMTEAQRRAQAVSFAHGNVNVDRSSTEQIPREKFEAAYDLVHGETGSFAP